MYIHHPSFGSLPTVAGVIAPGVMAAFIHCCQSSQRFSVAPSELIFTLNPTKYIYIYIFIYFFRGVFLQSWGLGVREGREPE